MFKLSTGSNFTSAGTLKFIQHFGYLFVACTKLRKQCRCLICLIPDRPNPFLARTRGNHQLRILWRHPIVSKTAACVDPTDNAIALIDRCVEREVDVLDRTIGLHSKQKQEPLLFLDATNQGKAKKSSETARPLISPAPVSRPSAPSPWPGRGTSGPARPGA